MFFSGALKADAPEIIIIYFEWTQKTPFNILFTKILTFCVYAKMFLFFRISMHKNCSKFSNSEFRSDPLRPWWVDLCTKELSVSRFKTTKDINPLSMFAKNYKINHPRSLLSRIDVVNCQSSFKWFKGKQRTRNLGKFHYSWWEERNVPHQRESDHNSQMHRPKKDSKWYKNIFYQKSNEYHLLLIPCCREEKQTICENHIESFWEKERIACLRWIFRDILFYAQKKLSKLKMHLLKWLVL